MGKGRRHSIIFIVAILLIVAAFVFSAVKILESTVLDRRIVTQPQQVKTITRNGKDYFPRQDIDVILLVGTDIEGPVEDSGSYNNKASADMVALMVFDKTAKECMILSLNRDTMMDIPVLGLNGKPAGKVFAQLATSHNYGSGLADSSENTKKAVSDFLYGLSVDYYFTMNMDGISILNDGVGGVQVTIEDDFSAVDPSLKQGQTLVLQGKQAYTFVRSRMNVGSQLNVSRMDRQKQYMEGFMDSLKNVLSQDASFFSSLWEDLSDYVVTDCAPMMMNQLASEFKDYRFIGCITPEGENRLGEQYYEFYADEQALDELILKLFYQEKS